ncbi:MAG: hypothetical protein ACRDJU_15195 [Actinomycetota bacterium]
MEQLQLHWDVDAGGHLAGHWGVDPVSQPPVDIASRWQDAEGALERAASYVRKAPTAG